MLNGLPKFPCSAQKTPLTARGFHDARSGVNDEGWPLVGIPTGKLSGIDVLDIDPDGVGWFDLNFDALPSTRAHSTRRGLHLLFNHADGLRCSTGRIAKGVDVKADGGYFIDWSREGYPFDDNPITEWPNWLLALAMGPATKRELGRTHAGGGRVDHLSGRRLEGVLDVTAYRNYGDWIRLMMACYAAGVDRDEWIRWSVSDPLYAEDAGEIERLWDSLKVDHITAWSFRVEVRLAELNKGICPKLKLPMASVMGAGGVTSQLPLSRRSREVPLVGEFTGNLQRRVDALLRQVSRGQEPLLFFAACRMREIIAERLNHDIALRLLIGSWPKTACVSGLAKCNRPDCTKQCVGVRRVIASAFLTGLHPVWMTRS
jgi:hypothetical protein